jgi:hypothetical protein
VNVIWRGNVVGQLNDAVPDMWYLDGSRQPLATKHAKEFEQWAQGQGGPADLRYRLRISQQTVIG